MKARMKRRRTMRRLTILVTVAVVAGSLAYGVYIVATAKSPIDSYISQPVPTSVYNSLAATSRTPYGDIGPTFASKVHSYSGAVLEVQGKPLVLYVGADYCQFCGIQRWSVVLALMRFGNFTGLEYMVTPPGEGSYPTFSFTGSTYQSTYVSFRGFELQDRDGHTIDTLPANYTTGFQAYGSSYPFLNFGGSYVLSGALADPSLLAGKNWTQIIHSIAVSDATGTQIRRAANVITGVICKLTHDSPASVCNTYPIQTVVIGLAGPTDLSLQLVPMAYSPSSIHR